MVSFLFFHEFPDESERPALGFELYLIEASELNHPIHILLLYQRQDGVVP